MYLRGQTSKGKEEEGRERGKGGRHVPPQTFSSAPGLV